MSSNQKSTTSSPNPNGKNSAAKTSVSSIRQKSASLKSRTPSGSPKSRQSNKSPSSKKSPSRSRKQSQTKSEIKLEVEKSEFVNTNEQEDEIKKDEISFQEEKDNLIEYVKELMDLDGLTKEMWSDEHNEIIDNFLKKIDKKTLIFYLIQPDQSKDQLFLKAQFEIPSTPVHQFSFFLKTHYSEEIDSREIFQKNVQYGTFGGKYLTSLLRLTSGLYAPLFFGNKTWPDTIKNDFSAQLHKFLASLTDTTWKMEGVTVLYIPKEGIDLPVDVASKNKELVQRLETCVIHWSRQLKDVLNSQDMSGLDETAGPLEEIEFWKARNQDLMGISKQLNKPSIKKITKILDNAKSSYVSSFVKLSKQIQDGSRQAENNLKFLLVLKDPSHELADAKPEEIPKLLPRIINIVRVIWTNSDYYNTRERLTAMFRKVSNEVIRRCCSAINLDKIFDGFVLSSKKTLNECIECCKSWKEIYNNSVKVHQRFSNKEWQLDKTTIFAQIDAFIQRCKDLIEICDCEVFFANYEDGEKRQLPIFGGQKGPEIARNLAEIELTFNRHLLELRRVKSTILDVKATSWHEDYNKFRSAVKEMEVMVINVINSTFDTITYVEQGVEILDAFMHLSARESIRRTIDKKTVDVYQLFIEDLNSVKRDITSKNIVLESMHPDYAGAAMWARGLKRRIEKQMLILNMAHFLPSAGVGDEARVQYKQTAHALDEFMRKCFNEWTFSLENDPLKLLEVPLLKKSVEAEGMIDVNLNSRLLKLITEIHYWERLGYEIPHYCADAYAKKQEITNTRDHVLTLVFDYNRIIGSLKREERGLFKERIKNLDKRIQPGFNKLTWTKTQPAEEFISTCRRHANELQTIVDKYKESLILCYRQSKKISELLLVSVDSRKIFESLDFEEDQIRHRKASSAKLSEIYDHIEYTLKSVHEIFKKDDSEEVKREWNNLIRKMHEMVKEAFRLNVKNSLLELSKAINGDGKSTPNPLFKVNVLLESYEENVPTQFGSDEHSTLVTKYRVNFSPTLEQLAHLVNSIGQYHLTDSISSITKSKHDVFPKNDVPIYLLINRDEEKIKIEQQIAKGMEDNAKLLEQYLLTWNNFREIWEINKDIFLLRYEQRNPMVSLFDGDIARYTEVENIIQIQETIQTIQFILLDCSPLKYSLLGHCQEWQNRLTSLLLKLATQSLNKLIQYFEDNTKKVLIPPETHYDLDTSYKLLEALQNNLANIQDQIAPLDEQFKVLEKYEVAIPNETSALHKSLEAKFDEFKQTLLDADEMLKKFKDRFKTKLLQQSEDFKKNVGDLINDFRTKGPFSPDLKPEEALSMIEEMKLKLAKLKEEEQELRRGLGIFRIDHPFSKEIQNLEKDIEALEQVWLLAKAWDEHYNGWKLTIFKTLETKDMDDYAQSEFKKLVKMSRDLREKNWEVVDITKTKVDRFRRTMPLVNDLHNKAMRDRHWNQIKDESNKQFDENGDSFTLEAIIDLHFEENAALINEVSEAASKEFDIEKGLKAINEKWEITLFETAPHKDKGHFKIKSTEDVMKAVEDDQVMLSTYKASRFVKPFIREVDKWERDISRILEVTEALLTVQRQWLYLENIFAGEDIRTQLSKETVEFEYLNNSWKTIMVRINKDPNAYRSTHFEGLDKQLTEMNAKLEGIQKSLDEYLETKKVIFPRFYFISNDQLLEILGQSKNPPAVQKHFKNLFDNIKSLKLQKATMGSKTEALSMFSQDGEEVPFTGALPLEGPVESWLCDVEGTMRSTLKDLLRQCKAALKKNLSKRDKWLKEWPGQLCITASQMQWTADCTRALQQVKARGDKKPLKSLKKKQTHMLNKFSEIIRGNLTKMLRSKIVALVTIEIHARDVIEKLAKSNCNDINGFEWLMQLRVYWDREQDDCFVKQTTTEFRYGYEYIGNSGRLVITPLTDRCYMTLTTALQNCRGGSPKGPAGTGKTETVKDLGKSLAVWVIVINCSEGLDYQSMGRYFSGLAQTGAWGCFDEFNRINIEVLSVVAQQILSIIEALQSKADRVIIEKNEVNLIRSCGIFITMNPGYAGRTELPDNLKSMFRPISMVVPDSNYIAEILLFGEGFTNTRLLAKKVYTLYQLSTQQLSKQDHYDFGLRGLTSVLRHAGRKKRANPTMSDEEILLLAMKDMNIPKMTAVDLPLFNAIVSDLFPGVEAPAIDYSRFKKAIQEELIETNLQVNFNAINKIIQLFETKNSRHSVMLVGKTQSGKTVTWKILKQSLTRLNREGEPGYQRAQEYTINPKAVTLGELYGEFDLSTNEWQDGILSSVMRNCCGDEKPDEKWIFFDAPVDAVWIESMNSVMDDNKILTLINSERIAMPEQVSLLFETEDLAVASPATVSRCGIVYCDYLDLGWQPHIESWILGKKDKQVQEELRNLVSKYIKPIISFKEQNCKELIPIAELNGIKSMCNLFDSFGTKENGVDSQGEEYFSRMCEMWFLFCVIWSIGASVDEDGRKKLDAYIRELEGTFPNKDSVYEYYVDTKQRTWVQWEEKLRSGWKYNPEIPFYKIIVPTVDTVRYEYLVSGLVKKQHPVLLTGPVGTGKTSVAQSVLDDLDPLEYGVLIINISAQTSSINVQEIIESRVEKRTKGVYVPLGGKKLLTFVDDFNMPAKDEYGSQPPLELIRQWLDFGFWYDRKKQTTKHIKDVFLMASMGPPGGGRTVISRRLQSRFNLLNMTFPQENEIVRIFGSMINQKLQEFDDEFKPLGDLATKATIQVYESVVQKFLPTPTKIHYLFNLRDISKVFQGLLRCDKRLHSNKQTLVRLWIHECFRVFADRLVDDKDRETFIGILSENLGNHFDQTFHNICPNKQPPNFADFMNPDQIYEDIVEFPKLKNQMEKNLIDYNEYPGQVPIDIVLFREAIEHVCRIVRVIRQPRGNMLLIGIGGSGRQSLSKLASFLCMYTQFQIEVSKNYKRAEFREDLKRLYNQAGVSNKETTFIFVDTQIVEESFLEDINNILSSGEVPNLFKADEIEEIKNNMLKEAKKHGIEENNQAIYNFLLDRVKANLHVIVCMSPVGEPFRNRIRMYPALVNCTTIDMFHEWNQEALLEVGERYLSNVNLEGAEQEKFDECRPNIAQMFSIMHKSVSDESKKMFEELRRRNYVTPTNFLELTSGYKTLLYEKRKELGDSVNKLTSGLSKIVDTRVKVEQMTVTLEENKAKAAKFQKECEDYLIVLVGQKREADEQAKSVAAFQTKIQEEESKCLLIAEAAQKDLDEAMPALNEALKSLDSLKKSDIAEVKAYGRPPDLVEIVMEAVMVLKQSEPNWAEAKRQLGDPNFINSLKEFDRDNIPDKVLKRINKYTSDPDFQPEKVGSVSFAAKSLCMWVRAMEMYGQIFRVVQPKRERYNQAMAQLKEKQDALADAKKKLEDIQNQIEELKKQYDEKMIQKEKLTKEIEFMEMMLDRATRLISGLAGEKTRWEETVADLQIKLGFLPGDCLLAAGFLSYMGPFLSQYREEIMEKIWLPQVRRLNIPCNPEFKFSAFLSKPTQVRDWNIQGLPSDLFSTENGVISTRGSRWPLMVDPQGQAIKWIKNMERNQGLVIFDLQTPNYMKQLETCIRMGVPCLCQNVKEDLDPSLNPVLTKSVKKRGNSWYLKLGDSEIEYNVGFKFYMATKLSNPNYSPEVSSKANIINFAVKEQGLEAQLLGIVVRNERADLEEQKDKLVVSIAVNKNKLVELEDQILRLLNETKGSLLDNVELVDTLEVSKQTSKDVTEAVLTAEQTEIKIDATREGYRPCAQRAAILFFVLNDLGKVDPMYQFSLDSYITLFNMSLEKSQKSPKVEERLEMLNEYHTYAVYRSTCRALFEAHKLLFSFQMCVKILEAAGKLNMDEYQFFLKGGIVLDRENQMDNPCPWLEDQLWDNITELSKLPNFHGIIESFEQYPRDWNVWYQSSEPEITPLPGEWDSSLNELQRMLIVRSLRRDRVSFCVYKFIVNNLGSKFVEPPVFEMKSVFDDSTCKTPLIFVLSPGVDPNKYLKELAEKLGMMNRFNSLSLGQGQAAVATNRIREGAKNGYWVFLANCHLSLSWMPKLDKIVEQLQTDPVHKDFRLWLSSSPHPEFPIAILQSSIKITTEPPKGIKANMKRLYAQMTESKFNASRKPEKYKKLLFSLCFFHSVLLERKKFLNLGWNINYSFNDSDFDMSEKILVNYLEMYEDTQWDALKYLIASVNYGGHVTDDWDMRLLQTYMNTYYKEETLQLFFKLSTLPHYYVPKDGPLQTHRDFVGMLPNNDHPEAFGQHPNADIASQIKETQLLFDTLLSLQPQVTSSANKANTKSTEEEVMEMATKVIETLPNKIDYEGTKKIFSEDNSPLKIVLLQEIERYNILLDDISQSLISLQKGIKGLVVMSSDLEEIFKCIYEAKVPPSWQKMYPSMKPLSSWTRDLTMRVDQLAKWSETAKAPILFWMSGFTFPTGFLTAVLQTAARFNNVSVDSLSWEFTVMQTDDQYITEAPKDGVYIKGLFLEAAAWDKKAGCLIEPEPMQLVCSMPTIHFKPVENKKKVSKGMYVCPCYVYPNRAVGSGRPSFVVAVDLKTGAMTPDHYVKRGTALLMSLDN